MYNWIIYVYYCQFVEWQVVEEFDEGFFQFVEVVVVGCYVVGVDIGDYCDYWLQVQEVGVVFVGFGYQVVVGVELGVGFGGVQLVVDDEGWVQVVGGEY